MRKTILLIAVLLTACTLSAPQPPEQPVITINVMPESAFWGSNEHYRVITCDPLTIEVDYASNQPIWWMVDWAMWDCGLLYTANTEGAH